MGQSSFHLKIHGRVRDYTKNNIAPIHIPIASAKSELNGSRLLVLESRSTSPPRDLNTTSTTPDVNDQVRTFKNIHPFHQLRGEAIKPVTIKLN